MVTVIMIIIKIKIKQIKVWLMGNLSTTQDA